VFKAIERPILRENVTSGYTAVSLIIGTIAWLSLVWVQPSLAVWILAFAPTVIVPLGLLIVERSPLGASETPLLKIVRLLQLPSAVVFVCAFWFETGWLAASLALPWLATTVVLAMIGLMLAWRTGWTLNANIAVAAALVFLPVGAGWAVLSRAGLRPQDFSDQIVLLTGVHFHYAGFALPILAACALGEGKL
jgi:hypothetical protein